MFIGRECELNTTKGILSKNKGRILVYGKRKVG